MLAAIEQIVSNPYNYEDYRTAKLSGEVDPNHPDFKSIDQKTSIWLDNSCITEAARAKLASLPADMPVGCSGLNKYKRKWDAMLADPTKYEDMRAFKAATNRQTLPDFRLVGKVCYKTAIYLNEQYAEETAMYLTRLSESSEQPSVKQS